MIELTFYGKVINGKLIFDNKQAFLDEISKIDGDICIHLKQLEKKKSSKQNNYYWSGIVNKLGKHLGYTPQEMHKVLKEHFNITSTKHLSSDEFKDYIDNIIRWASMEMGIVLPEPTKPLQ